MRLGLTEISKSENEESDFSQENCDAVDETMGSLSCDFEPLLDGLAEKIARKTEDMVCFDKPVDDLEVGMCKRENSTIMEDQNVFVSTENIVSVAVKEGKDFVTVSSNELDPSLKEEIKLSPLVSTNTYHRKVLVPTSPHKEAMEYKKLSANIQPRSIVDDDNDIKMVSSNEGIKGSHVTLVDLLKDCENTDKSRQKKEDTMVSLYVECKKEADNGFLTIDENGEGVHGLKRKKRGRKRKILGSSECDGDVRGKIEKIENRVLRSRRLTKSGNVKVDESGLNESYVRFKIKMEAECINQTELKDVKKNSQLSGQPKKKQKRRGRPPKTHGGHTPLHVTDDVAVSKKVERRGRPPKGRGRKGQTGNSSKLLTNAEKSNLMVDKKVNNQLKVKDVKKGDKIPKVQKQDGRLERREIQQLVRDKIANMLMKAGWTIEHRPRKNRAYLDAVYVDLNGGTHWSVTKAYYSLKKRIEDDKAEIQEVSAFTPVPDEEISVLFRVVTKVRSDKQKARKKKKKDTSTSDESEGPVKKKRKKKLKDGKKKKEVSKSDVKSGNKSLKRVKRQPNVSQKGQHSRKPRLVARSSSKGNDEDNDGSLIYNGKRNLVSWMIDLGVIMPGGKVQYSEGKRRNRLLEGKVTHDGIHCNCCNETLNISNFVSHGGGKVNQALKNIYFQSSSLLKCLLESWRKEEKSNTIRFNLVEVQGDDPNDDTCNICGDGGDLICCDGCPSTFHQSCLDIENFPSGVWHCVYCSCKFCGEVSQIDDSELISCCFCEEKFHRLCSQEDDAPNLDSSGLSFCGRKCQEIFEKIKTYVGVKFELEDGFSWTLLQRADVSDDSILVNAPEKIECNSKLAVAFSVMDECFVPIMDERSGVNVIHDVVYNCGSNFRRLNYSGFFTAVLERGDEMIAAASIRIHGNRLAEMPFIGTRHMYRRQGMCRRLLDAIESAFSSLGVKELVIPAIPELYKTWTHVFGFKPLKKSKRQAMKSISMIVFPGLDILQKPLDKNQFADKIHGADGDDKGNDDNALHSESKPSDPIRSESETPPATSFDVLEAPSPLSSEHVLSDSDVRSSEHKVAAIKNTFDLNLQPASTDSDFQSNDQDSFGLSNSSLVTG